jgi:ApeA N-terminal domain 1
MTLNLLDALVEQSLQQMGIVYPPPRAEIILGWLDTGEVCTLYKNLQAGSTFNYSGFRKSRFTPRMLFLGKRFTSPSEFTFSSITVSHTHTEEWLTYNPFESAWPKSDGSQITTEAKYASFPAQTIDIQQLDATVGPGAVLFRPPRPAAARMAPQRQPPAHAEVGPGDGPIPVSPDRRTAAWAAGGISLNS